MDRVAFQQLLRNLRHRPVQHGIPPGLTHAIVYMEACDASTEYQLLGREFSHWIKVQRGDDDANTFAWFREIVWLLLGSTEDHTIYYWDLEGDKAETARTLLFDSVDAFLTECTA